MPTIITLFGLRFYFFSRDHLPMHIHVERGDERAKFEIDPVKLIENKGMKQQDLRLAESIIEENKQVFIERWKEFFGQ